MTGNNNSTKNYKTARRTIENTFYTMSNQLPTGESVQLTITQPNGEENEIAVPISANQPSLTTSHADTPMDTTTTPPPPLPMPSPSTPSAPSSDTHSSEQPSSSAGGPTATSSSTAATDRTSFHPIHRWVYFVPGVSHYLENHSTTATTFPGLFTVYYATQCTCSCQQSQESMLPPLHSTAQPLSTNVTATPTHHSHSHSHSYLPPPGGASIESPSLSSAQSAQSRGGIEGYKTPSPVIYPRKKQDLLRSVSTPLSAKSPIPSLIGQTPPGFPSTATNPNSPCLVRTAHSPFKQNHPFLFHSAFLPIRSYANRTSKRQTKSIELHNCELVLFDPHARTSYVPTPTPVAISMTKPTTDSTKQPSDDSMSVDGDSNMTATRCDVESNHSIPRGIEENFNSTNPNPTTNRRPTSKRPVAIGSSIPFQFGPAPTDPNEEPFVQTKLGRYLLEDGDDENLSQERIYKDHLHLTPRPATPMQLLSLAPVSVDELKHIYRTMAEYELALARIKTNTLVASALALPIAPTVPNSPEMTQSHHLSKPADTTITGTVTGTVLTTPDHDHRTLQSVGRSSSTSSNLSQAVPFHQLKIENAPTSTGMVSPQLAAANALIDLTSNSTPSPLISATPISTMRDGRPADVVEALTRMPVHIFNESAILRLRSDVQKSASLQYVHTPSNSFYAEQQYYTVQDDGWYKLLIQSYVDCRCKCGSPVVADSHLDGTISIPPTSVNGQLSSHYHHMRVSLRFGVSGPLVDFDRANLNIGPTSLFKEMEKEFASRQQRQSAPSKVESIPVDEKSKSKLLKEKQKLDQLEQLEPPTNWRTIRCADDITPTTTVAILKHVSLPIYTQLAQSGIHTIWDLANAPQVSSNN